MFKFMDEDELELYIDMMDEAEESYKLSRTFQRSMSGVGPYYQHRSALQYEAARAIRDEAWEASKCSA